VGVENFSVLCITETGKTWALAAAEQQQKYIPTYLCQNKVELLRGEAIKCSKAVSVSQLGGYRCVKGPHFDTVPWPALVVMLAWVDDQLIRHQ